MMSTREEWGGLNGGGKENISKKKVSESRKRKKNGFEETRYESFTATEAVHVQVLEQDISDVIGIAFD